MADFPSGIIVLWHGAIVNIPVGWFLCDGNNGTPDLRDKWVVGAGLTYAVDQTGGGLNHSHTFTSTTHKHPLSAGTDIAAGANYRNETDLVAATGTTDITSHVPPYHALAWIMKT